MAITPNLGLPIIAASQAQKHVTHNESLARLDAVVQLAVLSAAITAPPASPSNGARYIVPTGATAAWAGKAGQVAVWSAGAWAFFAPLPGWSAWNVATGELLIYSGTAWTAFSAGGGSGGSGAFDELGVGGATPDATNKFAFYGTNMLFNSGASIDATFNKNAPANDASFTFKTAWATRALLGLLGSDDFSLKVSPDGSAFIEALVARRSDGAVRFPGGVLSDMLLRDNAAPTKAATFDLSAITAGQTRVFTLPNTSSEIAILAGTQTFTGAKTFSGTFTVSAATATFGTATTAATYGVGTGATASGQSKTVNIGTGGVAGSTTAVNIGPAGGANSTVTVNSPLTLEGLTADPVAPADGTMWHNLTTKQVRMTSGGNTRVVGGAPVPFTTPNSGQFIRSDSGVGTSTTTVAGAATRAEIFPWVCRGDVTIDQLGLNVTTAVAGALARIVVYDTDANGRPAGRLTETGDLDLSTVGAKVATVSLTLYEGRTYWFGVRHSSTATISAWQPYTTPNLPAQSLTLQAMGVYRRNIAWANAAPVNWAWNPAEAAAGNPPAVWLRVA